MLPYTKLPCDKCNFYTDFSLNNIQECIICFNDITSKRTLLSLDSLNCEIRTCQCRGVLHKKCFYEWYTNNHTCPICNSQIVLKTYINRTTKNICTIIIISFLIIVYVYHILHDH